jgi:hypothetical protein
MFVALLFTGSIDRTFREPYSVKVKVKQSHYRPGVAQRLPGI